MDLSIELAGQEAILHARELRNWIEREGINGVKIQFSDIELKPGAMGSDLVAALVILFGTKMIPEISRSIQTWLKARRPKVDITVKCKGKEIKIKAENVAIDQGFVDKMKELMQSISDSEARK